MDSLAHPPPDAASLDLTLLDTALLDAHDALLAALEPERLADDRFRMPPDAVRTSGHVYGGQLLAQALVAAGRTVRGKTPSSLHAAFVRAGTVGRPLECAVERVRDGRTMSTRQVTVLESEKPLLVATVSFQADSGPGAVGSDVAAPGAALVTAAAPQPEDLPLLQQWAGELPADLRRYGRHWIEQPPPIEVRIGEPPSFLAGPGARLTAGMTRSHWMRAPRAVGDDPLPNLALLAYASDFFLMDMVFRLRPGPVGPGTSNGLSLDHAIWFHRPVRFDQWHLHTQEALALVGNRGLARGTIHDRDGRLVASVIQEVLVFPETAEFPETGVFPEATA